MTRANRPLPTAAELAERLTPVELTELLALLERNNGGERLAEFIVRVSPHRPPPAHVAPVIELLERAIRGDEVRACI